MIQIKQQGKKIFFISDVHLPLQASGTHRDISREDKVIAWLEYIKPEAAALFLLGDIFDFWFEYKYLIPKSGLRFLAKLCEWDQAQIPIYFFSGNHDHWQVDYLAQLAHVQLYKQPLSIVICDRLFFIGHGDTLQTAVYHTMISKLYRSTFLRFFMYMMPADWLYGIVNHCYLRKRKRRSTTDRWILGEEDTIFRYCKDIIEPVMHHDFYIFGHTHMPGVRQVNDRSWYCNLGDWDFHYTYACFDGTKLSLHQF